MSRSAPNTNFDRGEFLRSLEEKGRINEETDEETDIDTLIADEDSEGEIEWNTVPGIDDVKADIANKLSGLVKRKKPRGYRPKTKQSNLFKGKVKMGKFIEVELDETKILFRKKKVDMPTEAKDPLSKSMRERMNEIEKHINAGTFEREVETRGILLALLSQTSCFFIGDVGTAKSQHIRDAAAAFGLSTFSILLSETTKPEHIFGPLDVPALGNGIQRIKTEGYAPTANVLFLDEIFKANGTVLNPLLWLTNEREFRNGDEGIQKCPIHAVFSASNEIPNDEALRAVYDRQLLRYNVEYMKSTGNIRRMFHGIERGTVTPLTVNEYTELLEAVKKVHIPEPAIDMLIKTRDRVKVACGITISDRRLNAATKVMKAAALLNGHDTVLMSDMEVLAHMFWDSLEQQNKVRAIVLSQISTEASDLVSYQELAEGIWDAALANGDLQGAHEKMVNVLNTVKEIPGASGKKIRLSIEEKIDRLKSLIEQRSEFIVIFVDNPSDGRYFKLSQASSSMWSAKQLRSVGLHLYKQGNYWWRDVGANTEKAKKKFCSDVQNVLGVKPTIKDL